MILSIPALILWQSSSCATDVAAARLDAIGVQLFYETTGNLSPNIAPPTSFTLWNTIIGEGDAKEPANDLVITAHLSVPVDEANVNVPLTIKVTKRDGTIVAQRTFKSLFFKGGRTVKAVFVPDATCLGQTKIEALFGSQRKNVTLQLNCGE
jgi:hypothetical protein